MKQLILTSILVAVVGGWSVQAGEDCNKAKTACADKAKSCCETTACCAKQAKARVARKAPEKGAMLLVKR